MQVYILSRFLRPPPFSQYASFYLSYDFSYRYPRLLKFLDYFRYIFLQISSQLLSLLVIIQLFNLVFIQLALFLIAKDFFYYLVVRTATRSSQQWYITRIQLIGSKSIYSGKSYLQAVGTLLRYARPKQVAKRVFTTIEAIILVILPPSLKSYIRIAYNLQILSDLTREELPNPNYIPIVILQSPL